jgi:hypothetical protein
LGITLPSFCYKIADKQEETTMRRIAFVIIYMLACAHPSDSQAPASPSNEALRIAVRLSTNKSSYRTGEAVPLKIEVSNVGMMPALIGNQISEASGYHSSFVEFYMQNSKGETVPQTTITNADYFPSATNPSPAAALIASWLVLKPGTSFSATIRVDHLFNELREPGTYTLSGSYSSAGPWYQGVGGFNQADIKAFPFAAWTGKIRTNTIAVRITPAAK